MTGHLKKFLIPCFASSGGTVRSRKDQAFPPTQKEECIITAPFSPFTNSWKDLMTFCSQMKQMNLIFHTLLKKRFNSWRSNPRCDFKFIFIWLLWSKLERFHIVQLPTLKQVKQKRWFAFQQKTLLPEHLCTLSFLFSSSFWSTPKHVTQHFHHMTLDQKDTIIIIFFLIATENIHSLLMEKVDCLWCLCSMMKKLGAEIIDQARMKMGLGLNT